VRILLIDGARRDQLQSGYGRIAAAMADGLGPLGHEVVFDLSGKIDVCLYTSPPWSMRKVPARGTARVGFTMHELEHLQAGKEEWPEILNSLDLVLTPTEWNRSTWRQLGVRTPIEVVPLGVDPQDYYPGSGHRCVFLTVHESLGSEHSRESWAQTLSAYHSAFTADDRVLLRVKTWNWEPESFEACRLEIEREQCGAGAGPAPVDIVEETLSHEQMRSLYLESSLFVKNANREGWSLPCTEAVACGAKIAASRIEPLISHLPAETLWFEHGDWQGLRELLRARYGEFLAQDQACHRYTNALMCQRVSEQLRRYCSPAS
jgi:hypothetical protein